MRSFGFRLTLLVGILWAGIGSTVWALGFHSDPIETVYVMPSSVSLPVATSYVVSTSWVTPTAYAVPTYYTTAYWMDPVVLAQPTYAATSYVRRRGLFGRRWVVERPVLATYATSYVPTTYVASAPAYRSTSYTLADPMVVPSAYVASADCVCPPAVASAAPPYASPSRGTGAAAPGGGSRTRGLQSEADDRASMSSNVEPPPENLTPIGGGRATGETNAGATQPAPNNLPDIPRVRDTSPTPPPAPAEPRPSATNPAGVNPQSGAARPAPGTSGAGQPGGAAPPNSGAATNPNAAGGNAGAIAPPTAPAPAAESGLGTPPAIAPPGEVRRDSMRPSTYAMRPVPTQFRNVLMGTVNSGSAGEPEEDVRVRVRNISTGRTKDTTTNAFGRFAVRLTEGDWAVDVTMPSGRVYEVSRLRVSDGLITDNLGRRVPTLDITR